MSKTALAPDPFKPRVLRIGPKRVPIGSHRGKLIVLGADHRGYRLKEKLKAALGKRGWRVRDAGPRSPRPVDYPDFAARIARAVGRSAGSKAVGIGICSSGIGMAVAAGKIRGVFPANPLTVAAARETRSHNNTNFLSLSASRLKLKRALAMAETWLKEPFYPDPSRDGRFLRRYLKTVALERRRPG